MMWKFREVLEDSSSDVRITKESKLKNDNKNQTKKKNYLIMTVTSLGFHYRLISYMYFSTLVHNGVDNGFPVLLLFIQ